MFSLAIIMIRSSYSMFGTLLCSFSLLSCILLLGCQPPNEQSQSALDTPQKEQITASKDNSKSQVVISGQTITMSPSDILNIKSSRYQPSLGLQGKIEPIKQARFIAAKPVRVRQVLVKEGQWVEKGEALMILQREIKSATPSTFIETDNVSKGATLATTSSDMDVATQTAPAIDKQKALSRANDQASTTNSDDKRSSNASEASRSLSSLITVRASFSGRVLKLPVIDEQHLQAGSLLLTLGDDTDLQFVASLPKQAEPQLSIGQSVNFAVKDSQKKYTGQVSRLIDAKSSNKLLVYVHVLGNDVSDEQGLEANMIATGRVDYGQIEVGTIVPKRAIHGADLSALQVPPYQPLTPLAATVWIIKQDRRLTRQPVEVIKYDPVTGQYLIAGVNNDSLICLANLPDESAGKKVVVSSF